MKIKFFYLASWRKLLIEFYQFFWCSFVFFLPQMGLFCMYPGSYPIWLWWKSFRHHGSLFYYLCQGLRILLNTVFQAGTIHQELLQPLFCGIQTCYLKIVYYNLRDMLHIEVCHPTKTSVFCFTTRDIPQLSNLCGKCTSTVRCWQGHYHFQDF